MAVDLDYTNIAGSPFQSYVATQIEKRKDLVYHEQRTPDQLQWLNNKNVWIRVSSGVNVQPGNKAYDGLEDDALSRKYILQGGVLSHPDDQTFALRYGVGSDNAYGLKGKSSDPLRPGNFGQVPMPGITNIAVKTGGKLGTLKETTIDFVCYGMEQLDIMEALYMKLGFSLLVEWGHTFFIDNKTEKIETNVQPLDFYKINSKEELMEKITEHRLLHSGNYDATWGTVKNFTYSLEGNGAFKCQVQLVGAGDILESLKINVSGNFKDANATTPSTVTTETGSAYPIIADANESLLNNALYFIYSYAPSTATQESSFWDSIFPSTPPGSGYTIITENDYASFLDPFFFNLNLSISNWESNTELQQKGYNFRLINTPGMNAPHEGFIDTKVPPVFYKSSFFGKLSIDFELTEEQEKDPGAQQNYITLGHLLLLIKSTGMLYQRGENDDRTKQKPYIYIDVNPETNRCYTFPGHCSLDPSICLIGSETLPFGITSTMFDDIKANFNWFDPDGLGGRFMYTLVNLDFVASTMKKYRGNDKKGDVNFVDLVKDILDGISKATGGYNEFRIVPDDDTRCVRILDDRRKSQNNKSIDDNYYTEIPILGYKSIVYNFNYTAKISPNTAAMVVVAAQAIPTGVQGAENALSFSHLNKGLYNRLGAVIVDSGTDKNKEKTPGDSAESRYIELSSYLEALYNGVGAAAPSAPAEKPTSTQNFAKLELNKQNAINQLNAVYSGMINILKADPNQSKYTAELQALNKAVDKIKNALNGDVTQLGIITKSEDKKYTSLFYLNMWIISKISNNDYYTSPNGGVFGGGDSDIENKWQNYLDNLTGGSLSDL